jgi:hypothetical protein
VVTTKSPLSIFVPSAERSARGTGSCAYARLDHPPRVPGDVLRARQVHDPATDRAWKTGVGKRRDRKVGGRGQSLDRFQHRRRADGAIQARHVHLEVRHALGERLHRSAVGRHAIRAEAHLSEDREIGQRPHGPDRCLQLIQVREGLEDEAVHLPLQQARRLAGEEGRSLLARRRAPRLDPGTERADGPQHEGLAPRCLAGEQGRCTVDLLRAVLEAVAGQLDRIAPERVGLEDLRSRPHVRLVDPAHELRPRDVELVVTHVHEDAAPVEHRPHGSVHDVDVAVRESLSELAHTASSRSYARLDPSQRSASSTSMPARAA